MKYLAVFKRYWADEFQAEGMRVITEDEKARLLEWAASEPYWYFGTNEGFECEDLSDAFTFTELTDSEAETLHRLIFINRYDSKFGQFPHIDSLDLEDGDY